MALFADLRLGWRRLRAAPVFRLVAVAVLALGIGVSAAVYSAVQSLFSLPADLPHPHLRRALPEPLRTHIENERLDAVTSITGLPLGVRDGLQRLFGGHALEIADPGAEFQATAAGSNPPLPIRRLAGAGCSTDHCLVYYERGGSPHTWQVALFHWTPMATRFEWGASAPGDLATFDDVRRAVLSGAIDHPNRIW